MTSNVRLWIMAVALPAVFACSNTAGPEAMAELHVAVEPMMIAPGDTFVVTVHVINPTGRPMHLTSGCGGALYWIAIGGEESTYLAGSNQSCLTVVSPVELPAGVQVFQHRVWLARMDGVRVEPGAYRIEARSHATRINDNAAWVDLVVKDE